MVVRALMVVFSPDSRRLASGLKDHAITTIWDVHTATLNGVPLNRHEVWIRSVTFPPDGQIIVRFG